MPNILPSLAAPAKHTPTAAAATAASSRARDPRVPAAGRGGFDEALSGARRKQSAPPAAAEETPRRADRAGERPASGKASKAAGRAEARDAREARAERTRASRAGRAQDAESTDAAPAQGANPVDEDHAAGGQGGEGEVSDDRIERRGRAVDDSDLAEGPVDGEHPATGGATTTLSKAELPAPVTGEAKTQAADDSQTEHSATEDGSISEESALSAFQLAGVQQGTLEPVDGDVDALQLDGEVAVDAVGAGDVESATAPLTDATATGKGVARPARFGGEAASQAEAAEASGYGTPPKAGTAAPTDAGDVSLAGFEMTPAATDAPTAATAPAPSAPAAAAAPGAVAAMVQDASPKLQTTQATPAPAALPQVPPEVQFAEDNHPNIVAGVRGQLMPEGGTMRIRLDPPELGPLAVTVRLRGGVMEASFETASDEAAKLLSHSLGALKTSLESHGVNVERLHVQQTPKDQPAGQQQDGGRDQQQGQQGRDLQHEQSARQEQQRRELLRRMWRKLSGTDDPLDLVA
jgi:flagellar hook-length control protein FliK